MKRLLAGGDIFKEGILKGEILVDQVLCMVFYAIHQVFKQYSLGLCHLCTYYRNPQ